MKNRFELKHDCNIEDLRMISPKLMMMLSTLLSFADSRKLPVVITSIISDRINVIAKSTTHEDGRALDISVVGWSQKDIKDIKDLILFRHKDISAISASDGKHRPIVYHNYRNQGDHLHLQCRR